MRSSRASRNCPVESSPGSCGPNPRSSFLPAAVSQTIRLRNVETCAMGAATATVPTYITSRQVCERYGVSRMWIWRALRHLDFPQPFQIGGERSTRRWLLSEIEAWERGHLRRGGTRP